MKTPKNLCFILAVAWIAIFSNGCGSSDYRAQWAQHRRDRVMAQARLGAVQELLAEGRSNQAQRLLEQGLPQTAPSPAARLFAAVGEDEGDEKQPPAQYAHANLRKKQDPQEQTW